MKLPRLFGTALVLGSVLAGIFALNPHAAHGTDLQDSQTLVNHPQADINDVYLYQSPGNANNVVLQMDVDSALSTTAAGSASFDPNVLYQFKLSHTAAAGAGGVEDTVIQILATGTGPKQTLTLFGPAAPNRPGAISTVILPGSKLTFPFGTGTTLSVPDDASPAGGAVSVQAYAGLVSDPSIFDLARFYKLFPDRNPASHVTGQTVPPATETSFAGFSAAPCATAAPVNYFQGTKTLAIVLEMPKSYLKQIAGQPSSAATSYVHMWATTSTVSGN